MAVVSDAVGVLEESSLKPLPPPHADNNHAAQATITLLGLNGLTLKPPACHACQTTKFVRGPTPSPPYHPCKRRFAVD